MFNTRVGVFKASSGPTTKMSSMEDVEAKMLTQAFSNYAHQTSLHGWQYIESEVSRWRKAFWALVSELYISTFLHYK